MLKEITRQRKLENKKIIFMKDDKSNNFYKMDKNVNEKLMNESVTKLQKKIQTVGITF